MEPPLPTPIRWHGAQLFWVSSSDDVEDDDDCENLLFSLVLLLLLGSFGTTRPDAADGGVDVVGFGSVVISW